MDVVFSLVGVLGLVAGLVLVMLASWDRQRARRTVIETETELRISREAAARQLLELRKRLAEAESDQAHIASLQDEVRRLREKNRQLRAAYAPHEPETGTGRLVAGPATGLAASESSNPHTPPQDSPERSQGRLEGASGAAGPDA
ncbi:hypothetical protein ACWA7J_20150 [Leptothrix sp. BB-4]